MPAVLPVEQRPALTKPRQFVNRRLSCLALLGHPAKMFRTYRGDFLFSSLEQFMASIFKRSKGKNVPYTIQYLDHLGNRKTEKGFTDKGLTEQLAAKLETDALLRASGLIDPAQERLAEQKLSPIDTHVVEFLESISERSPKYIQHTTTRLKRIIAGAGITKLADIEPEVVAKCLRKIRKSDKIGPRTYNHYVQAIDAFCNWCVPKRMATNPLTRFERLNVDIDVRHKRRALSESEFTMLVTSARDSEVSIQCFTGEQRARIYLTSYLTGLRQKELGSLMPRSFDLKSAPPTVTVEAISSKHKKLDVLPLHPTDKLFKGLERKKAWFMIKKDLERVGLQYKTDDGYADFHACRHTHITDLLRNGATLTETQKLARHSDINMTMKYVHIGIEDQATALAGLPSAALHGRCISGGGEGQLVTLAGNPPQKRKSPNPCRHKGLGVDCQPLATAGNLEAGGIEPPS
jgi:site-specific recombinase XerD